MRRFYVIRKASVILERAKIWAGKTRHDSIAEVSQCPDVGVCVREDGSTLEKLRLLYGSDSSPVRIEYQISCISDINIITHNSRKLQI